jgi:putative ABC transport system ATP-binding protein
METTVLCKNLKLTYGTGPTAVEALRGIDLEVNKGELLMLMGPSGSGKTTLVSVIAGILTQTEGECLISNLDLNHMPDKEKTLYRGTHIGFVFQKYNLIPMLTTAENISVPLLILGQDRTVALEKAKKLLFDVGIPEKADVSPVELSGGQQQRVAIARALIHDPDIIVCDEPTSALDHESGMKVMDLLRSVIDKTGKTLIVVSHDPRIQQFAHRIVKMEDGKIVK